MAVDGAKKKRKKPNGANKLGLHVTSSRRARSFSSAPQPVWLGSEPQKHSLEVLWKVSCAVGVLRSVFCAIVGLEPNCTFSDVTRWLPTKHTMRVPMTRR
jgi:hypothetical protein